MSTFPQLNSGAIAQYPLQRQHEFRTLVDRLPGSTVSPVADVDFERRAWQIELSELTDSEWSALSTLFDASEGKLGAFSFPAPGANLLAWSEDVTQPVWTVDPGLGATISQPDPFGGSSAIQLTGGGGLLSVFQVVLLPANYRLNGSVWARCDQPGGVLRVNDVGVQSAEIAIDGSNQWRRYSVSANFTSASPQVGFVVFVPAGSDMFIYGPQIQAQPAPSAYRKTKEQSGLYHNARFDQDTLIREVTGLDRQSGVIQIVWTPSQT